MSSLRTRAETKRGSQYFVNILTIVTADVLDSTGAALTGGASAGGSANTTLALLGLPLTTTGTIGLVMVRDMGTQVTVPADYQSGSGNVRRVLRKVQVVAPNAATATTSANNNANDGVTGSTSGTATTAQGNVINPGYGCFYIEVGGISSTGSKWVSLSIPN